jgi:hypothetical protein
VDEDHIVMPAPTAWPLVVALGITCMASGLLFQYTFSLIGLGLFIVGIVRWFGVLISGNGYIVEELVEVGKRAPPVQPVAKAVLTLEPGMHGHRMRVPEKLHPYSAGIRGGLAGGFAMAIVALAYGLSTGHGIWYPVNMLAAMVVPGFDIESIPQMQLFSGTGLLIGLAIHVFSSLSVGLIYAMLLPMLPRNPILVGGVITPLLWTGLLHGSMGVLNPVMGTLVDWPWFIASQIAFGVVAGLVVVRSEKVYSTQLWGGLGESEENQ